MNRNDRTIVSLAMVAHALVHTYELSIPILVSIWLVEFPTTPAELGVIVTIGMALFGLGALPGGVLADSVKSTRLIAFCVLGMGGSFVVLGAAPGLPAIALALVLWGVAASVYHPAGLSLISRGVEARGQAFAYHGMAGNLGIALGPLITTLLLLAFDWRVVVTILAAPAALAALLAVTVDVDERAVVDSAADGGASTTRSLTSFLADSKLLFASSFVLVFGVVIFSGLFYRGVLTFLPELLSALPLFSPVEINGTVLEPARYLYAGLLMIGMGGQYVGGYLTDHVSVEAGLSVAFAVLAVVALVFVPAANAGLVPLLVASAFLGAFLFVVQPLYQAAVAEHTPAGARGLSYGFTYLGVFGIGALGAAVAGTILTYWSPSVLFVALAGFALTASLIAVVLYRRHA